MKIVIIGNGIAGTTLARFIRKKSDHEIIMISSESYQPFSRTALMYIYMGHLKEENTWLYEEYFWEKNRIQRLYDFVASVDVKTNTIHCLKNGSISYDKLIIATGSISNKFGWPGQDLQSVQGLYHLSDLYQMEKYSEGLNHAVVVGGGLIGVEMAEMFHSRGIRVSFLVREKSFWNNILPAEESAMINRHLREHHIDLRLGTELKEILGDANGKVSAVITNHGTKIDCQFVGLTVGVSPNITFLKGSGIEINKGVLVNEFLQTNIPNVYAIGDCAELRQVQSGRRPIEAIWYTGRMMGQTLAETICNKPVIYTPKLWFNSAKFFDIEYQVYGEIKAKASDAVSSLYWEHRSGKKSLRINYNKETQEVLGFNLMGIRYRHEVCEKWILQKTNIFQVLNQLTLANFDPEFYTLYENEIIPAFSHELQMEQPRSIKRNYTDVYNFLQS